jgi:outer membrane protein
MRPPEKMLHRSGCKTMSRQSVNGPIDEQRLVKLYMELTGSGESAARNVFMYVSSSMESASADRQPIQPLALQPLPEAEPEVGPIALKAAPAIISLALGAWLGLGLAFSGNARPASEASNPGLSGTLTNLPPAAPAAATNSTDRLPPLRALTLAAAINLALRQNPNVRRAQQDIQAAQGIAVQTRAIALPSIGINGTFGAVQRTDVDIFEAPGFTFGTPQNWSSQLKLVQSLYEGGRMLSAIRAARLTRQQSYLQYQTVLADTVLAVQLAYDDVLLAQQQITVEQASVELLTRELADTNRRFQAGTVPRFNVLRAEVELANERPKLLSAQNNLRISKNNLANLLGLNIPHETSPNIPISLAGNLEAEPYHIDLGEALRLALQRRTELKALTKAQALRKEDLISARAGFKPRLQGYVGYDIHNSMLSQDLSYEDHGWIAGAQLSWNLFDGLLTQGRIRQASANYQRAGVDLDDMARRIELEVRTAYSNFLEARELLDTQKKVQEEADEALRLARARAEAGTGTQLDVLSAQTALTQARTTEIQALHDYAAARARLQRAVGMNVPNEPGME